MVNNYSTYVVEDLDTGEWLHVGKQKGTARSEPLEEAMAGKYPKKFHNKSFLVFLYAKNRNLEVKIIDHYETDTEAKAAERELKKDPRADYAYRKHTNYDLSTIEFVRYRQGKILPTCRASNLLVMQCLIHGDIFCEKRTPYKFVPERFKCLFKI